MRSARTPAAIQRGAGEAVTGRAPPISLQRSPAPLPAPLRASGGGRGRKWARGGGAPRGGRRARSAQPCSLAVGAGSGMAAGRRRRCEVGGGTRLRSAPSRRRPLASRSSGVATARPSASARRRPPSWRIRTRLAALPRR